MIGVHIPILVGILEYAFLLAAKKYYWDDINAKNIAMESNHDEGARNDSQISFTNNVPAVEKMSDNDYKSNWDAIERKIDKWTFVGSLTFILIFTIVYWFTALM